MSARYRILYRLFRGQIDLASVPLCSKHIQATILGYLVTEADDAWQVTMNVKAIATAVQINEKTTGRALVGLRRAGLLVGEPKFGSAPSTFTLVVPELERKAA